mgnify:CR=1 FL=1|jgi:hypothetical protein
MPIRNNGCYCFTLETIDTVDIFTKVMYKQLIVHSLNHFIDSKGLVVYGWCLMTNKLYVICEAQTNNSIKEIKERFVEFTREKIVEAVKEEDTPRNQWILRHFQNLTSPLGNTSVLSCWGEVRTIAQINLRHPNIMAEHLEYIHILPVKERIVQYPADYIYSSARDYVGLPGLVKVTKPAAVEQELYEIESRKSGFRRSYNY